MVAPYFAATALPMASRATRGGQPVHEPSAALSVTRLEEGVEVELREIYVIPIGRVEVAAPASAGAPFPELTNIGPYAGVGRGCGSVSHSQVSRQSGRDEMEALRCSRDIRIELRRHR